MIVLRLIKFFVQKVNFLWCFIGLASCFCFVPNCVSNEKLLFKDYQGIDYSSKSIAVVCISRKLTAVYHNKPVDSSQTDTIWRAIQSSVIQDMKGLTKFKNIFYSNTKSKIKTTSKILPGTPRSRSFVGVIARPEDYIAVPDSSQAIVFEGEAPEYILFINNLSLNSHFGNSNAPIIFSTMAPLIIASAVATVASQSKDQECVQMQIDYVIWDNVKRSPIKFGRSGNTSCVPADVSSEADRWSCATYEFVNGTFGDTPFFEDNRFK